MTRRLSSVVFRRAIAAADRAVAGGNPVVAGNPAVVDSPVVEVHRSGRDNQAEVVYRVEAVVLAGRVGSMVGTLPVAADNLVARAGSAAQPTSTLRCLLDTTARSCNQA